MKLAKVTIENFRVIKELEIDFGCSGDCRQITSIVGDNGSGKTTVLQAIGLVLSLATRRSRYPEDFPWHGFRAERLSTLGKTRVEVNVLLDEEEVQETKSLFGEWIASLSTEFRDTHQIIPPSVLREVTLVYQDGRLWSPGGLPALHQFLGRYYIRILTKTRPWLRDQYDKIGGVFWFDQMRNLGRIHAETESENGKDDKTSIPSESWEAGVDQLREYLVGWWAHHTSPEKRGKDYIPDFEKGLRMVFPGITFRGVAPRESESTGRLSDFYFFLERDGKVFDISEMSSGEQAVVPIIYEFTRLSISKSIVLIDELELHLHPPQQQALLASLSKIGPDCQFVFTTHSPYLEQVVPDKWEVRLPGGQRCL